MDVSDYLPMFLAEGREHLQNLNLALVRVEQDPRSDETTNEIFRIAHSLKGMSATMGFSRMASLTHEMENVLELLRGNDAGLPKPALDVLFQCLDCLEEMTGEIESAGTEATDPAALVGSLRSLVAQDAAVPAAPAADGPGADVIAACEARGLHVVQLEVELAADADMPSVRLFLACRALEEHGEIVHSEPPVEAIERGDFEGGGVVLWVATGVDGPLIAAAAAAQEGIGRAEAVPAAKPAAPAKKRTRRKASAPSELEAEAPAAPAEEAATAPTAAAARRQTVRVDAERLDLLMHLMGEMVVQRTRLEAIAHGSEVPGLGAAMGDLSRVAQSLQTMVMQVRMVPIESVFMRFPRMVRDLAGKLGKHVDLQIRGEETELDRTVVEALGDPLVHLIRNAIDHGLEGPEERVAAGKPETGVITISAHHSGGDVVITVRDDGRGVDPARVGAIAVERGLIAEQAAAGLSVGEAIELLFHPGFSTTAVATDVSGRGVGMDAVRSMVRNLGGEAAMTSEPGLGSCATVRLPLTLAILPALLVRVGDDPYALPLDRVEQTIRIADYTLREIGGDPSIVLRDAILPLHDLGGCLGLPEIDPATSSAVVVRAGDRRIGLIVEELIGQQELVTRPLPPVIDGGAAVSGGAVLGDGQIALIVDCDQLVGAAR